MNKKLSSKFKKTKKALTGWAEYLHEKGETIKKTIDFTVKSSLYIYVILWALLLEWLILTKRIETEELLPNVKQLVVDTEYLLPLSTLVAVLFIFTIVTPFSPNLIKSKAGRTSLFIFILILFLYLFARAAKALI